MLPVSTHSCPTVPYSELIHADREGPSPPPPSPKTEIGSSSSLSPPPQLPRHRKPAPKLLRQAPLRKCTSAASISSPTTAAMSFSRTSEKKRSKTAIFCLANPIRISLQIGRAHV